MDSQERRPCEDPLEPVAEESVERTQTEGADEQSLDPLVRENPLEFRGLDPFGEPPREEKRDRHFEPAQGEREGARRRGVEPLHIVDRQ